MSWPTWSAATAPIPTAMAAPVQPTLMPTAINSAPTVIPPGIQYSPEQWAQAQQQNWQQWAQWQQQYQQWHQQYGAEYQKSMSALQGLAGPQQPPLPTMPNTGVPPPLPAEPKPPLPPEDPPVNQPTSVISSYSTMPPKPINPGYSTLPPPSVGQQAQLPEQFGNLRQDWQTNQSNPNKRPFGQSSETQSNKRPLLERPKQWGNQKPVLNQWTSQPPPNISYNQPPPQTQPTPKPNIEELSEAEKKFDKEFAAWEAQFNKWKDQNANHPDKTQYMEYEKKWESWRNSLLERREQMRRKRLAMSGVSVGVTKPTGPTSFTQTTPNVQQPFVDQNRLPGYGTGPAKPSPQSPLRQQTSVSDFTVNPNLSSHTLPHQNDEPLSFKPQILEETGEDFLKPSFSDGGIPGLDLVKDDEDKDFEKDDVEIDKEKKDLEEQTLAKGPDFDAISKGINSILGDQKLLSMLSMVSQNPPSAIATNTPTNSVSTIAPAYPQGHDFSAPPPSHQFNEGLPAGDFSAPPPTFQHNERPHLNLPPPNDPSNRSYEDRSGENYQNREFVNNFGDQTPSSFTMGLGDQDLGYGMNHLSRNQLNSKPPNRFTGISPSENERTLPRPNFGPSAIRTGDLGFGGNMSDNRNKFGPLRGNTGLPNFPKNSNFSQGDNLNCNDFSKGNNPQNENFNRGNLNTNRQDNYQNDNTSKCGDNFSSVNSLKRNNFDTNKNLDDRRNNFGNNNFNRSGSYNEQNRYDEDFTKDTYAEGDYDDYENYNEDEDYEKYHEMFNEDEENQNGPPRHQGQGITPRSNQGQGFPTRTNRNNQGQVIPSRNNQGQVIPPRNNQGQVIPPRNNQGQVIPPHNNQGQVIPPRNNQGQVIAPRHNQGQGVSPRNSQGQGVPPLHNQGQGISPRNNQNQVVPQRFNQGQEIPSRNNQSQEISQHHDQGQMMQPCIDQEQGQRQEAQKFDQRVPPPRLMDIPIEPPPELIPEEPIFEPTTIIDYDHKSLKPIEPEVVVEPIHMFDYRHKPLNRIPISQRAKWLTEAVKFIREFDPLASRGFERASERYPLNSARRDDRRSDISEDRYGTPNRGHADRRFANEFESYGNVDRKPFSRDDNRIERELKEIDENYSRRERRSVNRDEGHFDRDLNDDRNHHRLDDDMYKGRRHMEDNSSKQMGGKDFEEFSDEEINFENRELKNHQQSRGDREGSRSPILSNPPNPANVTEITMIEDIINQPGRFHRPPRIVIILRGPPGSGKTYLAKLIKDKEVENGGSAPRILSLDDYFMIEQEKEVVEDGKRIKVKEMVYEYEPEMEESYRASFIKSFKKTIMDGYFPFIIVDNINDKVKYFGEMWSFAKQNGFQVYICQLDLDPALSTKRNIHNRTEAEIEECIAGWEPTPNHHPTIDASGFLQSSITDVEMEEVEPTVEEVKTEEAPEDEMRSKWDTFDCSINNLAKLDGVSKPLRTSRTMEDYLQMENRWEPTKPTKPGQKRVRWADMEEQREQKKMRAIGFIVGHTNWNRMMDPTDGGSALTQTKYI